MRNGQTPCKMDLVFKIKHVIVVTHKLPAALLALDEHANMLLIPAGAMLLQLRSHASILSRLFTSRMSPPGEKILSRFDLNTTRTLPISLAWVRLRDKLSLPGNNLTSRPERGVVCSQYFGFPVALLDFRGGRRFTWPPSSSAQTGLWSRASGQPGTESTLLVALWGLFLPLAPKPQQTRVSGQRGEKCGRNWKETSEKMVHFIVC
ncbi:uncharacterized protein LOC133535277 isoform X2 [Nerophis ophidion]|uniref:uncharacterized protein LOC133535277 isoform X2 n=1 Tax=Nerophis ophidion TaxID=159077 RepID=UPI002ADF4A16|nr:uncharacterized protein LOC133535277 isoform X2 [Nerophis ophidion]